MAARRATRPLRIEAETASDARHVDVDLAAPGHYEGRWRRRYAARLRVRAKAIRELTSREVIAKRLHRPEIYRTLGKRKSQVVGIRLEGDPWERDLRSEERRVGKECRSRWSPYH